MASHDKTTRGYLQASGDADRNTGCASRGAILRNVTSTEIVPRPRRCFLDEFFTKGRK